MGRNEVVEGRVVNVFERHAPDPRNGGYYISYAKWPKCGGSPLAKAQFLGYNCVVCCFIEKVRFV